MKISWNDILRDPNQFSIAMCWEIFSGLVLPKDCLEIQRTEMRRAFYAGFTECFKFMTDMSSELEEKDACKILDKVQSEANRYHEIELQKLKNIGQK